MFDAMAAQLAVARLLETSDAASRFRQEPDRPLAGYCMITGDQRSCRITVYLENGQTLGSRRPGEPFYYEAWLVSRAGAESLGAFNTDPHGDGSAAVLRDFQSLPMREALAIRITAEPFGGSAAGYISILEGELIWLQGNVERRPDEAPSLSYATPQAQAPQMAPQMAPAPMPWANLLASAGQPGQPGQSEPEPTAAPPHTEADIPAPPDFQAGTPAPEPQAIDDAEADPLTEPEPVTEGFKLYPEPATPVMAEQPAVPLESRHPLVPRAAGTATLSPKTGALTISIRGLPSPAALGRLPNVDRPYNTYRVWLSSQRSGNRMPLGLASRIWGENFRFESEPGLPLNRYDTIIITADDRGSAAPNLAAPQVLVGTYELPSA